MAPKILIAGDDELYLDLSERLPVGSCRLVTCDTFGETLDRAADSAVIIVNAHIGGGVFGYSLLGVPEYTGITTGRVFLPEVSAAFRLNDWFSLGVAGLGIYIPELTDEGMAFLINVLARFRVN